VRVEQRHYNILLIRNSEVVETIRHNTKCKVRAGVLLRAIIDESDLNSLSAHPTIFT